MKTYLVYPDTSLVSNFCMRRHQHHCLFVPYVISTDLVEVMFKICYTDFGLTVWQGGSVN